METVGILIELENADQAYATIKRIESSVKSLGKNKTMIKLDDGNLQSVDDRIKEIQDRLAALSAAKKVGVITDDEVEEAKRLNAELKVLQRGLKDGTQNARSFKQEFQSIQSVIAHIGSGMQSLGNALTRLSSPFTRLTTGLIMGAGYKLLNTFTEGFSNSFERYDTMINYARSLQAFGFEAEQAREQIDKLDLSVRGLPTGLDEIVAAQKVYVGATNDLEKATNLAIAANNTFLASGMGSREQRFMQKYLVALGSGAKLAETQWTSMARIAPLAMRSVSQELGYADEEYQQFIKDVKNGTVSTDEFLNAFIKVGTEGKVQRAANVLKMTFSSLGANISNATKRMGENVIKAIDDVFVETSGRTLLQTLLGFDAEGNDLKDGIKDWINDLSQSVQDWIRANPDKIIEFFETLKGIDWKGLLKGMAEGIGELLGLLKDFTEFMGDKDLSKFGKRMIMLGAWGRGLTILGGIIKGMRGPLALIFTLASRAGKGGGIFGALGKILGGGAKAAGGLGGGAMSTIGQGIGKGTFLGVAKWGALALEIEGFISAFTLILSGTFAADMALIKKGMQSVVDVIESLKQIKTQINELQGIELNEGAVQSALDSFGAVWKMFTSNKKEGTSLTEMQPYKAKRMAKTVESVRQILLGLRKVAYQINQAASTSVDVGGFKGFIQQIKDAVASLQDLNQTMELDIKVVLGNGFKTSVDGVVKQIKNARKQIQAAVDYISQKTFTTTVRVNIKARVNMSSAISSINQGVNAVKNAVPVQQSMGGMIYRAKGGSVPWKRRGTDTVPAMLTPGEYVHNKRAVNTFGIDFMRKVNNLDMKGAMNELMHRAGHMANVNRGTTITNNYNNNQRVVQNINTNSADFAFRSASRFVGAF